MARPELWLTLWNAVAWLVFVAAVLLVATLGGWLVDRVALWVWREGSGR